MRYRYLDDFRRGISVFAIFSYGIAVLGTPQCPPQLVSGDDSLKLLELKPTTRSSASLWDSVSTSESDKVTSLFQAFR